MLSFHDIKTIDGVNLYGVMHEVSHSTKPIVIIAHGYFSSNRIGPHRLYYQIAKSLSDDGFNVIRCDLRGFGESDGSIENVKFENHVSDLETVATYVRQLFKDKPIILIAHCIGCSIGLSVIEQHADYNKKAIFISPYFTTESTLNAFFSTEQQNELNRRGYTYRKGIYADSSFFSGINMFSEFSKSIGRHSHIISVISASNDQYVSRYEIDEFYKRTGQSPIIIQKADHNYLDSESRDDLIMSIQQIIKEEGCP